jgi:anthranilate phosphoribosyltransferase
MTIDNAIKKLAAKELLTEDDVRDVINQIMRGETTSAQIGGFLIGLKMNGESPNQILGAVKALRDNFIPVKIENPEHLIDTCGTGGDGAKTFNISTAVAIVAASGGAKVAKHGNRAVSSKSGSADVLAELGIKIDFDENESRKIIEENGMAFLFAPKYNGAMKNVAKERKELGTRTIFNIIGPLSNPAPLTGQLLGVYDEALVKPVGEVLLNLGLKRALVVNGDDGLDEITTTTTTNICEIKDGEIKTYKLAPEDFGIDKARLEDIKGGDAKENSEIILKVLKGEKGAPRDIVALNAGAALYVAELAASLEEGIMKANDLIDSGAAYEKYKELSSL